MANSVEEAVYEHLQSDSTFMGKFGGIAWYEGTFSYPYITFFQVDDPGTKTYLNTARQGEARLQFDVWDDNKGRGALRRTEVREKIEDMNTTSGGYTLYTVNTNEATVQRQDVTDPWHYVVDAIVRWFE